MSKKSKRRVLVSRKELRTLKEKGRRYDSPFGATLPPMTLSQLQDYLRLTPAQKPVSPVPVYTGLEHFVEQKVMIFSVNYDGRATPCQEWLQNSEDDEWTPLSHMFGFYKTEDDDFSSIPIYSKSRAEHLIKLQEEADSRLGFEDSKYVMIPVGYAPEPVNAISPNSDHAHAKKVMVV